MADLRKRLHRQFDPLAWSEPGLSPVNQTIMAVVLLSILFAVLGSEPSLKNWSPGFFDFFNLIFAVAFSIEYGVRLWAMGERADYRGIVGRLKYAKTIPSVVDVIATAALWVDVLIGVPGVYGVMLRLVRVLRALTLSRNSRWATAMGLLWRAVVERRTELALSFGMTMIILLVAATLLFAVEGQAQPDAFGSIPRAMWWSLATLTTVGYGDVYPVTAIGKLCAGLAALTSIAVVAMPTGILAAAFSDCFQEIRGEKG